MSKTGNQQYGNYSSNNNAPIYDPQAANEMSGCICNRSPKRVLCPVCGYNIQGRVRQICASHPNVVHLMDLGTCPSCKADCLREIEPQRKNRNTASQQQ